MNASSQRGSRRMLLIGKNGQIGWELKRALAPLGEVVAVGSGELDLSKPAEIRRAVREMRPDLIVNAAAYTAVDAAEEEPELAMAVNGEAPGVLAEEAQRSDAALVHYSTDYVFDGAKGAPYTEDDEPAPINIYGETKLAGERAVRESGAAHLILRTSWVYGLRGKNFLLTVLRLAREREELRIVDDQIGAPTWSREIAEATAQMLGQGKYEAASFLRERGGLYHLTAGGQTSWYSFARAILDLDPDREEQVCESVEPVPTSEYPTPARRTPYSVLCNGKLKCDFGFRLPEWYEQLKSTLGAETVL